MNMIDPNSASNDISDVDMIAEDIPELLIDDKENTNENDRMK